jgi:hypothetical protein
VIGAVRRPAADGQRECRRFLDARRQARAQTSRRPRCSGVLHPGAANPPSMTLSSRGPTTASTASESPGRRGRGPVRSRSAGAPSRSLCAIAHRNLEKVALERCNRLAVDVAARIEPTEDAARSRTARNLQAPERRGSLRRADYRRDPERSAAPPDRLRRHRAARVDNRARPHWAKGSSPPRRRRGRPSVNGERRLLSARIHVLADTERTSAKATKEASARLGAGRSQCHASERQRPRGLTVALAPLSVGLGRSQSTGSRRA